ncbi:MAG: hypothetical protein AVDCRST_MAG77-1221 [uncultured Chloroflexi bacterium]|uniref:Uncharacterized protein n=1 Tax=uncultured Chloroflexota bacterium TaxID=166587 RepID=A0A6J4HWT8_9CHLR|nr:MAG: hypothetical protein AVDCRST_MAG77-1221 [uncultured Chloroflexota bacterium]
MTGTQLMEPPGMAQHPGAGDGAAAKELRAAGGGRGARRGAPAGALSTLIYSLLLGMPFVGSWLGYTATTAEDGRERITAWLDPMLAGLTLAAILVAQLALVVLWPRLPDTRPRRWILWGLIISQWSYTFGEVLSNTITLGEPPQDIGSLFEIGAGALLLLCSAGQAVLYATGAGRAAAPGSRAALALSLVAMVLFAGMLWWFTHPIDQSEAGAPPCVPGNPLYTLFHGPCP